VLYCAEYKKRNEKLKGYYLKDNNLFKKLKIYVVKYVLIYWFELNIRRSEYDMSSNFY